MKWYLKVFKHYADFGGRARPKEFWYFVLFNFIAAIVAVFIDAIAGWDFTANASSELPNYGPCYQVYAVAALLPALAVAVRRLHDLGKSGGWLLIGLVPLVGSIWLIVLFCTKGESGTNRYGANPKSVEPSFPERRRGKSIAIAFIVGAAGAAVALIEWVFNWIQHDIPVQIGLISTFAFVLMLFFGIFYHPAGDARKTANRRNIAFVLLTMVQLVYLIWGIPALGNLDMPVLMLGRSIVAQLANLALLALAVLLLLKSERKFVAPAAVSTIVLTIVGIVGLLVMAFVFHHPRPFGIVLDIAIILLAVHCLQGKAAEEEEKIMNP